MNNLSTLMPAIVVVLTVLGAIITYVWQKQTDKKHELVVQRRSAYTKLLVSLNRHLTHQCLPNLAKLNEARAETILVASDEVAKSVGNFFKATEKIRNEEQGNINSPEYVLGRYAEMVLSMRQDCFEKSKLDIRQAVECAPITYSEKQERTVVE